MLSESDSKHSDNCINLMGFINDLALKVINGDVTNMGHELNDLRVSILQQICLETLYAQEAKYEDMKFDMREKT